MKIGNKILWTNGRGNYCPASKLIREHTIKQKMKLDRGEINDPKKEKVILREYKSLKHGLKDVNSLRKGLNTRIRQLAKKYIIEDTIENLDVDFIKKKNIRILVMIIM